MFLYGNCDLKPLQIGETMTNNKIMQFSYFYSEQNLSRLRYGVMLLEKCIMGYY